MPFTKSASLKRLLGGFSAYIYHTKYVTPFGNVAPHVKTNVLKIPITIIHQYSDSCTMDLAAHFICNAHEMTYP